MPGFGDFNKGEKKKAKKGKEGSRPLESNAPTYVMPDLIPKKKKDW